MAFLAVSQPGEFKNTTTSFWKKSMSKTFCQKLSGKKLFLCHLPSPPLRFFVIAFLAVSLHDELKNTTIMFSKSDPKISKDLQKRQAGRYVVFLRSRRIPGITEDYTRHSGPFA
jgi:hypothetical protein